MTFSQSSPSSSAFPCSEGNALPTSGIHHNKTVVTMEKGEKGEDHHHDALQQAQQVAIASSTATVLTKTILHPLDTLKCRFQVLSLSSSSCSGTSSSISSNVGTQRLSSGCSSIWCRVHSQFKGKWGARDLYGGLPPKLLLYVPYQTTYITTYDTMQQYLQRRAAAAVARKRQQEEEAAAPLSQYDARSPSPPLPLDTMTASVVAELASAFLRVPMESMKMWVQAAAAPNSLAAAHRLLFCIRHAPRAALRLAVPQTLIHDIPYSMTQWLAYEALRPWARRGGNDTTTPTTTTASNNNSNSWQWQREVDRFLRTCAAGGGAGFAASVATIPLDHIRTRALVWSGEGFANNNSSSSKPYANNMRYTSTSRASRHPYLRVYRDIVVPVYRSGGLRGFYRGGAWRVAWVTSNMALYFPLFELLRGVAQQQHFSSSSSST